ncbi:MAG: cbb3-type cytochrome c oxidase subunit I, partial [Planctomycetota bacterium]
MESSHHEHEQSFVSKYVFPLDHKMIGLQYLFAGIFFLFAGGFMALLMRWQLAAPNQPLPMLGRFFFGGTGAVLPEQYNSLFTLHGTIMVFFAVTPILVGAFGNYLIPLQIGARDMAMPRVNMISFWMLFVGGLIMLASMVAPGGPAGAGWTSYPPLSGPEMSKGHGQTFWILGLTLGGTSSLMGAINYIATILTMRTKGMTLFRMPLTIWGLLFSAVLNLLFVPVVAAALILLLMDRLAGTAFFAPFGGSTPLLFQHLFWFFGHPEVYILILPIWGIVGDLLSVFSRKPAFGYKATIYAMLAITAISGVVWGHHMYTAGMSPKLSRVFMTLTVMVSIPSAVFFLNWLATLWRGAIRLTSPMLAALGVVLVFALGGLTGIFNAAESLDLYLHDTYFVVGHFHMTLAASVLLGIFGGIYYWFPKMFGRMMNESLAKAHVISSFALVMVIFNLMMLMGAYGMPRRYADPTKYEYLKPVLHWNITISHAVLTFA